MAHDAFGRVLNGHYPVLGLSQVNGLDGDELIEAYPNSRVCDIVHFFGDARVEKGMTVSNPFFERNRTLRVALEHPGETTDVAAIRDRLELQGAKLVTGVEAADVVVVLDPVVEPIPGKLVVGPKAIYTFLKLRP